MGEDEVGGVGGKKELGEASAESSERKMAVRRFASLCIRQVSASKVDKPTPSAAIGSLPTLTPPAHAAF